MVIPFDMYKNLHCGTIVMEKSNVLLGEMDTLTMVNSCGKTEQSKIGQFLSININRKKQHMYNIP